MIIWSTVAPHQDRGDRQVQRHYVGGYAQALGDVIKELEQSGLFHDETFWNLHTTLRDNLRQATELIKRIAEVDR